MATPQFAVVPSTETPGERIRRLQQEARQAAHDQVDVLERELAGLQQMAREIAQGGEAYPVGVRELCRHLVDDLAATGRTLGVIVQRSRMGH